VQPKGKSKECIDNAVWAMLRGNPDARTGLIQGMAAGNLRSITHPFYRPLHGLLAKLASFLVLDRHWLEKDDIRNKSDYTCEAFQRLILEFLLENRGKDFMMCQVEDKFRVPCEEPQAQSQTGTSAQLLMGKSRKRVSSQSHYNSDQHVTKAPRASGQKSPEVV
jgi:hypothetical protein